MNGAARRIAEWVGPHVPDGSDGILTSAGICEGFAGAGVGSGVLIFGGFAGARGRDARRSARPIMRMAGIGALAMVITYLAGLVIHPG